MNKLLKGIILFALTLCVSSTLSAQSATQRLTINIGEIHASEMVSVERSQMGARVVYTVDTSYISNTMKELALEHTGMDSKHLADIHGKGEGSFTVEYHFDSAEEAAQSDAADLRLVIR